VAIKDLLPSSRSGVVCNQHDCGNGGCGHEWGDSTIPCWPAQAPTQIFALLHRNLFGTGCSVSGRRVGGGLAGSGTCFAGHGLAGLCPLGWLASGHSSGLRQYECRLRQEHEFDGGIYTAQFNVGIGGSSIELDDVAKEYNDRSGLRRVRRLQLAMERTRCRVGSRLQAPGEPEFIDERFASSLIRYLRQRPARCDDRRAGLVQAR
jgi:hypothetical protein